MKKSRRYIAAASLLCLLILPVGACAPRYNVQLEKQPPPIPVPVPEVRQDTQTLVFVALSGGGTRAAAMSWKTLEVLKQIPYTYQDPSGRQINSTLADEIDYISGISGGSFAAAAWCLYKNNMEIFRRRFIERDIQGELAMGLIIPPWQGLRLLSPEYDRINMAAELYDRTVFEGKTFGDLPPHPVAWIHATHLALGDRFTFTPAFFNRLDSDLARYPIGYACAASSAFPILLSPLTVINYGEPVDLSKDIDYVMARRNARNNIEKYFYARMLEFYNDKRNRYMHLADGGLVDNQGLQAIIDEFGTNGIINKKLNDRDNPLKRLIIIDVNAGVLPDDKSSKSPGAPHISSVIEYTMVTSMDILSAKRWMEIKALSQEIYKPAIDIGNQTRSLSLLEEPYTIEINFRNIKDPALKARCYKLPTSFYLKQDQIKLIDTVVPSLIAEDPEMIRLKKALGD
jgi:NTE family protein